MSKEKTVKCPHCEEVFKLPGADTESSELLAQHTKNIEDLIQKYQAQLPEPKTEDHRHKTADEFLDCPECALWVQQTAKRYQVTPVETKEAPEQPEEKPQTEEQPQAPAHTGSIFGKRGGEGHD